MTSHDEFGPILAGWFEEDARASAAPGELDRILERTSHQTPRPALFAGIGSHAVNHALPRRTVHWPVVLATLLAIGGLVAVLAVGAALLERTSSVGRLGQLAYHADHAMFIANWDGSDPVRISDRVAGEGIACFRELAGKSIWAPDGRHLAFRDAENTTVHIADPTGRLVASVPGYGSNIAWSPDATRIATWAVLDQSIGVFRLDGTRDAVLRLPPGFGVNVDSDDPTWSPDGRSLLVQASVDNFATTASHWELPIDGRTPIPIPDDDPRLRPGDVWAASDDGASSAYIRGVMAFIEHRGEAPVKVLLPGPSIVGLPVWFPTDDRVVFAVATFDRATGERGSDLRIVNAGTGAVTTLIEDNDGNVMTPIRFSPTGDRLLYSTEAADGSESLRSIRADGTDDRLLVDGTSCGDWQVIPPGS